MVSEKQIEKMTEIVVREADPVKVYLFGSYAREMANSNSDVDVLIVVKGKLTKEQRRNKIAQLLLKTSVDELMFPKDFKVYSEEEFNTFKNIKSSFLSQALNQSRSLYAG